MPKLGLGFTTASLNGRVTFTSGVIYLKSGDYVSSDALQGSGSALNVLSNESYFNITLVN